LDICTSGFNAAKIPLRSPPAKLSAGFVFQKCFAGVKSLNERGSFRRGAGRLDFSFVIGGLILTAAARQTNLKIKMPCLSRREFAASLVVCRYHG